MEAVGKVVGDQKLTIEGALEQKDGKTRNALGGARDVAREVQQTKSFSDIQSWEAFMTKHLPEAPPANRSDKGPGDFHEPARDTAHAKHSGELNTSEQGDTANIKQNTTNKGFFRGRRIK
jgi:hypothetical protein